MDSVFLDLGFFSIKWYGVMMAVAFMSGMVTLVVMGKKDGRDINYCSDLTFWGMVLGILGARLTYILLDLPHFMADPIEIIRIDKGGLVYYGGFLGAGLAILMFARNKGEKVLAVLDFSIIVVPVAHFFGRIGCFMNGCCFGKVCSGPFSVSFPEKSYPWHIQVDAGLINETYAQSMAVIPVQIYEAVFNLGLGALLLFAYPRRKSDGQIIALYLLVYPPGRFILEFMRGDPRASFPGVTGFSQAQVLSIALFFVGLVFLYISRKTQKRPVEK